MTEPIAAVRHKLSDKQFNLYIQARRKAQETGQAFEAARAQLSTVAELILDVFNVDPNANTSVDEKTKELVVVPPQAPVAAAADVPKSTRRARKPRAAAAPEIPSA